VDHDSASLSRDVRTGARVSQNEKKSAYFARALLSLRSARVFRVFELVLCAARMHANVCATRATHNGKRARSSFRVRPRAFAFARAKRQRVYQIEKRTHVFGCRARAFEACTTTFDANTRSARILYYCSAGTLDRYAFLWKGAMNMAARKKKAKKKAAKRPAKKTAAKKTGGRKKAAQKPTAKKATRKKRK
jgi:hypothetical protein